MILNFPEFRKEVDHNSCIYAWSEELLKAYSLYWLAFVFISSTLMAGLYSRVVYILWFKRNDDNELTYQQQVMVITEIHSFCSGLCVAWNLFSKYVFRLTARLVSSQKS